MTEPKNPATRKVKRRKVRANRYELYVPGRDGALELVQWAFHPRHGRVPRWYRHGYWWHLVDPAATAASQEAWEHRLGSFDRVWKAEGFVAELVEWAEAVEAASQRSGS